MIQYNGWNMGATRPLIQIQNQMQLRTHWTWEDNKLFEQLLVEVSEQTPDRWNVIGGRLGRCVMDVFQHYRMLVYDINEIECDRVPLPRYADDCEYLNVGGHVRGKRKSKNDELEREKKKKGVPWTEDEHRQFLIGLEVYGKGDWKNIARNSVISRTPTQVASHAQKFFMRQTTKKKERKRSSIHDITIDFQNILKVQKITDQTVTDQPDIHQMQRQQEALQRPLPQLPLPDQYPQNLSFFGNVPKF